MLAYVVSKKEAFTVIFLQENSSFHLQESEIQVIFHEKEYYLRFPHTWKYIKKDSIKHGHFIQIENIKTKENVTLYFSQYDDFIHQYDKFVCSKKQITIGSQIDDDIYIQDTNIKPKQFLFDLENGSFVDTSHSDIACLNGKTINELNLRAGDCIQVINLKIIYHDEFLMINTCENIYHEFPKYIPNKIDYPLVELKKGEVYYHYRNIKIHDVLNIFLDEPLQNRTKEYNPLVFSMGPALTMSSASLLSGLLSVYNGYLNGRELYELMPMILLPSIMLFSSLFWNPFQRLFDKHKDKKFHLKRIEEYKKYLCLIKEDIENYKDNLKKELLVSFPELNSLAKIEHEEELFQRCDKYDDYLLFRLGVGIKRTSITYERKFNLKKNDQINEMIRSLQENEQYIDDAIITFSLKKYPQITYCNQNDCIPFLNRILLQITSFYSREKYAIGLICDKNWINEHLEYLNIPHIFNSTSSFRYIACTEREVDNLFTMQRNENKYLFLFVQKYSLAKNICITNGSLIYLSDGTYLPSNSSLFIHETNDQGLIEYEDYLSTYLVDDIRDININHYFICNEQYNIASSYFKKNNPTLYDLYHIHDIQEFDIQSEYKKQKDTLRAIIGIDMNNDYLTLDLSEKGNGPHGLIAGTTGSGKSEFIITLILSFALHYHPRELQFVLIDFKGGGVASVLATRKLFLPHIIGVLDNLDDHEIERALASFKNECKKREMLFQQMTVLSDKSINNLVSYQHEWKESYKLPYLSDLIIIIDEFAELKLEYPEFLLDLMSISRIGRSLGIHLILVTQKPAGIVNEQIWSNCHFKICLKVQEKQDSREVLHRDDAANIYDPGEFYFLSDDHFVHAKSGYANADAKMNQKKIEFINYKHEVILKNKLESSNKTQAIAVLEAINEALAKDNFSVAPLWLRPLESVSCKEINYDSAYFGILDDYYHNKQEYLSLDKESEYYYVISPYYEERINFIYTILYALFKTVSLNEEIYMIDDLSLLDDSFLKIAQFISIFTSDDYKKLKCLFNHIEEKKDKEVHTTIVITDLYSFMQNQERNTQYLHELLEIGSRKNCSIIMFSANSSALHYRDKLLVSHRITLKNENTQDIASLFEAPVKKKVSKIHQGMIYKENALIFQTITVSMNDLKECIQENIVLYHENKPYRLPSIPKVISLKDYLGNAIPLGICIENYDWVTITKEDNLFVLATYENEFYAFYKLMKETSQNVLYLPSEKQIKDVIQNQSDSFLFMTIDQYQFVCKELKENIPILYIGTGFHEQYTIRFQLKEKLASNEALFLSKDKKEVIQLVQKRD